MKNYKKWFAVVCFGVFLFLGNTKQPLAEEEAFRLVVFGDSLTSGYNLASENGFVPVLEQRLHNNGLDNVRVINASRSGDTTAMGLARIDEVLSYSPHAVILELGINDVLHDLSLDTAEKNLQTIIETLRAKGIPVLLVGMRAPFAKSADVKERLVDMYTHLSKRYHLMLYPYFLEGVLTERFGVFDFQYMQDENAHPNAEGIKMIVKKMYPTVEKFLLKL